MKYTKEQYEELINNSPLFDVDKERDSALYDAEKYKLIERIIAYYNYYIFPGKPLDKYDLPLMEAIHSCIKSYNKSKGIFLHFLSKAFSKNFKVDSAKQAVQAVRGGMTLDSDVQKRIVAMIKFTKAKHLDMNDEAVQQNIAIALQITVNEVKELLRINANAVVISDIVTNDGGDEVSLFDTVASHEIDIQTQVEFQEMLDEIFSIIAQAYRDSGREANKPILRDLITLQLIEFDEVDIDAEELCNSYPFYSAEVIVEYRTHKVTRRMIGEKYGKSEQSIAQMYARFEKAVLNAVASRSQEIQRFVKKIFIKTKDD